MKCSECLNINNIHFCWNVAKRFRCQQTTSLWTWTFSASAENHKWIIFWNIYFSTARTHSPIRDIADVFPKKMSVNWKWKKNGIYFHSFCDDWKTAFDEKYKQTVYLCFCMNSVFIVCGWKRIPNACSKPKSQ